jgi:hypothetical protein
MAERTRAFKDVRGGPIGPSPRRQIVLLKPFERRLALAALLTLTLFLGLFARASWFEAQQSHPTALVDLFPDGERMRGADGYRNQLPDVPGDSTIVLILRFLGERTYPHYLVRIEGRSGRELWSDPNVRRDSSGSFPVSLPRRALSEVPCSVEVYGINARGRDLLETYSLKPARNTIP